MSKKVLGALLAIVMVLSVFSVTAFAAGATSYEEDATLYKQTWSLTEPTAVTGGYQVSVILTTNYKVGPISFKIEGADSVTGVSVGGGYYAGSYSSHGAEGLILITPNTAETVEAKAMTNAVVATVTYTSASNATPTIANNPKTAANPSGTLIAARCDNGSVNASNFILGQTVEVLGAGEAPEIIIPTLTGTNGGCVDETRGYVYGVPASTTDVTTFFTTNGYIEVVANAANAKNGTGATLNLYQDNSKATLVKSYTLVIFGDVNGDGALTLEDAGLVGQVANYLGDPFVGAYEFAANVNADTAVTLEDAGLIGQVANYLGDPITNPWANA